MEMIVRLFESKVPNVFEDYSYSLDKINSSNFCEELKQFRNNIKEIKFLTSNINKLKEVRANLNTEGVNFSSLSLKDDLVEIQDASVLKIVQDKCQRASELIKSRKGTLVTETNVTENCDIYTDEDCIKEKGQYLLIEDTCLNFKALNGMPGPYIKWFLDAIGAEGLCKMLSAFHDKSAEAICIYALMPLSNGSKKQDVSDDSQASQKTTIVFFRGLAKGQIVEPRRADHLTGWGWDLIFEEERSRLTFAEMTSEMKSEFSHRAAALKVLKKFLEV